MKTIQMTLDDDLIAVVDKLVEKLHTTRSAFTRVAIREAIRKYRTLQLEKSIGKDMRHILLVKANLMLGKKSRCGRTHEGRGNPVV